MHISDFTAALGNPAKPFKWDVIIPALPTLAGIRAQSAQWPSVGSTDIDLYYQGQIAKFPGTVEYEHTWTCNIVESELGDILSYLWEWRQLVFNQTDGTMGSASVFKRDITLRMLTDSGATWATCVLRNAYPKNVDTVELDKSANTEAYRWNIVFNFDWWDRG